jgi:hypothetical protein
MQVTEADTTDEPEAQVQEVSQPAKDWPAKCVGEALTAHAVPLAVSEALTKQLEGLVQKLIAGLGEASAKEPAP